MDETVDEPLFLEVPKMSSVDWEREVVDAVRGWGHVSAMNWVEQHGEERDAGTIDKAVMFAKGFEGWFLEFVSAYGKALVGVRNEAARVRMAEEAEEEALHWAGERARIV